MFDNINIYQNIELLTFIILFIGLSVYGLWKLSARLLNRYPLLRHAMSKLFRNGKVLLYRCTTRRTEILVIGDSHARVFDNAKFKRAFPQYFFNVVSISGASASGLENPNSKTQTLPIIMANLNSSKASIVIALLGEVDAGFVIWYRAEKHQSPLATTFDKAVHNYQNLLRKIATQSRTICISAPLPTIQDGNDWGRVANERRQVKATQLQRTELTLEFNQRIQTFCEANAIAYLPLDPESLGKDGLVNPYLLNPDANDHHYNMSKYADLIIEKLRHIFKLDTI
jgi:hypothetical protein